MLARAKVNLYLHITGKRADGYHLLDSLIVFADTGDEIALAPADKLSLTHRWSVRGRARHRTRQSGAARGAGAAGCDRHDAAAPPSASPRTCRSRPASAAARPTRRRRSMACAACGTWRPDAPRCCSIAAEARRRRAGLPRRRGRASSAASAKRSGAGARVAAGMAAAGQSQDRDADAGGVQGAAAGRSRSRRAGANRRATSPSSRRGCDPRPTT